MDKKTHWKKLFNYDYLGSYDLEHGQELVATIDNVERKDLNVPGTGRKENKPVLTFAENIKPMVLNATNSRTITAVVGSNYIEDWKGHKVIIYIDSNIRFGKDIVEGLRIKMAKPATTKKPRLTPQHPKWKDAVTHVAKGVTLDQARVKYTISKDVWSQLEKEADELKLAQTK